MELEKIYLYRLKNKLIFAVKNVINGGIFLVTPFFDIEKRVTGTKGFETKTITDDGVQRTFCFLY